MPFNSDSIELIFIAIVLVSTAALSIYGNYRRKNQAIKLTNTPVLLSYYTDGSMLLPIKQGMFGDMYYSAFVTVNVEELINGRSAGLIFRVELPFQTSIHLMGIPKAGGEVRLNPAQIGSLMERADLEGDFNKYFDLFCEKDMQTETRYVLDPKAMLFTLDFCQSQSWEVVANELYFVQTGPNQANDPTLLTDDIVQFVREIKPALAKPLTNEQKLQMTPYGKDRRTDLLCPLCQAKLINTGRYFVCPKGEGMLLTGSMLTKLREASSKLPKISVTARDRSGTLDCPSCGNSMEHVAYNGSRTMIDSCSHCAYRWLDAGELNTLPNQSHSR